MLILCGITALDVTQWWVWLDDIVLHKTSQSKEMAVLASICNSATHSDGDGDGDGKSDGIVYRQAISGKKQGSRSSYQYKIEVVWRLLNCTQLVMVNVIVMAMVMVIVAMYRNPTEAVQNQHWHSSCNDCIPYLHGQHLCP